MDALVAIVRTLGLLVLATTGGAAAAEMTARDDWQQITERARGQTVYFNAWGGDLSVNRYIEWAAGRVRDEFDVQLRHVRVTDIAEAVARIRAERAAGRTADGSVDLLWINGENFAALKNAGLLFGPWAEQVPHAALIDWRRNPTTRIDNALATDGYELPWGTSMLTLFFDRTRVVATPDDPERLQRWIERHPGRFTYPQPPAFVGSAFLKQLLLVLVEEPGRLQRPVAGDFDTVTAPLWRWLDRAHRSMWRSGRLFPHGGPAQRELLAVGEVDWTLSYNPSEASRAIAQGDLHANIGAMHFSGGALANSHFLAIPFNASATEGARVVANFLLSPAAQARKADESHWGDLTVLDPATLDIPQRQALQRRFNGAATPPPPRRLLSEPHASWTTALEHAWRERYTRR